MSLEVFENANGSTPSAMMAVESKDQSLTNDPKLFEVKVVVNAQLELVGCVCVYATAAAEAFQKVQSQIEDESLDDDLHLEDDWTGATLRYGYLKHSSGVDVQIGAVDVVEEDVDPADVLKAEVEELQAGISWNPDALAKHKAFLESLGDEQAVAA